MAIPNDFNDIIKKQLNVFAAWIPIVNQFSLGDYGIFSNGVFSRLGNITDDFQISFDTEPGTPGSIDFTSADATVVKFAAGAKVDVIPAGQVNARVDIEFSNAKSFLIKSPVINVLTMKSINTIGNRIIALGDKWDGKWKVVSAVYTAEEAVIISSMSAGTKLSFSGDATALEQLKLGSAGISIGTNKELGLKIQGKTGTIGLGLFIIDTGFFGGVKIKVLAKGPVGDQKPVVKLDAANTSTEDLE